MEEKVKQFVRNEAMSSAVYNVIQSSFLKSKGQRDVQTLAAERLALELLEEAWRGLNKFKDDGDKKTPQLNQVGL